MAHSRSRRRLVALCAGVVAAALSLSGCGAAASAGGTHLLFGNCPDNGSTGITTSKVRIGSSGPLSGPNASGVTKGLDAFLAMVNGRGGVTMKDGRTRTVENVVIDDGNEIARAGANADDLIQDRGVFALVGMYGTPGSLAARAAATESCVPELYMATGHQKFGDPAYPWVAAPAGVLYPSSAHTAAQFISREAPGAKIGLLTQQDDLGGTLKDAFVRQLQGTGATVVSEQTFDRRDLAINAQVTTLAGSGADTFVMLAGSGAYQLRALEALSTLDWKPRVKYLTNFVPDYLDKLRDNAAIGVYFSSAFKNVTGPEFAGDPEVALFTEWWGKTSGAASFDPYDGVLGWMIGRLFVQNLATMSTPTRAALMDAATHFTYTGPSLYRPGVVYSIDWPDRPYGLTDEIVMGFDPRGVSGQRYRAVDAVTQHGQYPYLPSQ